MVARRCSRGKAHARGHSCAYKEQCSTHIAIMQVLMHMF
jgi:hypothetical protein